MIKLILFDIDGTLIDPAGAGTRSANRAFEELFAIKDAFAGVKMAGKTDIQIMKEGLSVNGLTERDGLLSLIFRIYISHLRREIKSKKGHIKPGVKELLGTLSKFDNCRLGLLTGNIQQGARIKLETFGLSRYFTFGAFGDDNEDRNMLMPIAVSRFQDSTGMRLNFEDCIVVGDTPMDVICSKPFGAKAIAVSTGPYSYEALKETAADYILEDLSESLDIFKREIAK